MFRFVAVCCLSALSAVAFAAEPPKDSSEIEIPSKTFGKSAPLRPGQFSLPFATPIVVNEAAEAPIELPRGRVYVFADNSEPPTLFSDSACLTMRSYIFRREKEGAGVSRLTGSRTCTEASKFRLHPAQ